MMAPRIAGFILLPFASVLVTEMKSSRRHAPTFGTSNSFPASGDARAASRVGMSRRAGFEHGTAGQELHGRGLGVASVWMNIICLLRVQGPRVQRTIADKWRLRRVKVNPPQMQARSRHRIEVFVGEVARDDGDGNREGSGVLADIGHHRAGGLPCWCRPQAPGMPISASSSISLTISSAVTPSPITRSGASLVSFLGASAYLSSDLLGGFHCLRHHDVGDAEPLLVRSPGRSRAAGRSATWCGRRAWPPIERAVDSSVSSITTRYLRLWPFS